MTGCPIPVIFDCKNFSCILFFVDASIVSLKGTNGMDIFLTDTQSDEVDFELDALIDTPEPEHFCSFCGTFCEGDCPEYYAEMSAHLNEVAA